MEGHIIDGFAHGENSVLDLRHIPHSAATRDHINVGILIYQHDIVLVAIVKHLADAHIAQVVIDTHGLILLGVLIQSEQVHTGQIIHVTIRLDDIGHLITDK